MKSETLYDRKDYIKLADCKLGCLYRIHSRNLTLGVYDGKEGFIGIRLKFKDRYLFTEYHWDQGPPFGTVKPLFELGPIPEDLKLVTSFDTVDQKTRRRVEFDQPVSQGGKGWYFVDSGEASPYIQPVAPENQPLFDYLDEKEKAEILKDA